MKANEIKISAFLLLAMLFTFSSCRKFDEPPISDLPILSANMTIKELQDSVNTTLENIVYFDSTSTIIIGGVVIADDKSGNFYKSIVIQDSTAGISIPIDANDLYEEFPIGRFVYVRMKGIYAVKDGNIIMISASSNSKESRLSESSYRRNVVGGEYGFTVIPKSKTFSTLTAQDYNTLVTIDGLEVTSCYVGSTYANVVTPSSGVNMELYECATGGNMILRNSDFSKFAGLPIPAGNGSITVVYSAYGSTNQLLIRDTSDVDFNGTRCTAARQSISIDSLRILFDNNISVIPANRQVEGVVISDLDEENIYFKNVVVQDASGKGIVLAFPQSPANDIKLGDYIKADVSGKQLSEYGATVTGNGWLQVDNVINSTVCVTSSGNTVTPKTATVADVIANNEEWESTLVTIQNCTISGGATYGANNGNLTLSDGTGSITLRTLTGAFPATFASASVPSGTVTVTAIISQYQGSAQLSIRNLNDVVQ